MNASGRSRRLLAALAIEAIALVVYFPAFIDGMMRHSAAAPRSQMEQWSSTLAFILHLPTVLITYPFGPLVLVTPVTQVVFWAWLLRYLARRRAAD